MERKPEKWKDGQTERCNDRKTENGKMEKQKVRELEIRKDGKTEKLVRMISQQFTFQKYVYVSVFV